MKYKTINIATASMTQTFTRFDKTIAPDANGLIAARFKITNVEFKLLDILQVATLNKTFDFIISIGVSHHMETPEDGLSALEHILNPGGMTVLGLYSRLPRKDLVNIKADVLRYLDTDEQGITPEGVCQSVAGPVKRD
ncbi:MAG: cyclopropane fatty-acyl-phospholipid synthase-like methyltransferase [Alteromonadaceae bacterium]|jgi:cyclopropane fatty-acyl-phospholipid synthase-like methyltransferase